MSDEEGSEDDDLQGVLALDDQHAEPYNFGRTPCIANMAPAKFLLPSPLKTSEYRKSIHNLGKFSWGIDEEIEEHLPTVKHQIVYLDISEIETCYSASNLFVMESPTLSMIFTGTLKHATTDTKYMVYEDRIYQWIRGAACSG